MKNFLKINYSPNLLVKFAKALALIPLDAFQEIKYNHAHLAIARASYLRDKQFTSLIKYGLLWDIAHLFAIKSMFKVTQEEAFDLLLEHFELPKISQSQKTCFLLLDSSFPEYSEECYKYLQQSVESCGYYNTKYTVILNVLQEYIKC